MVKIKEGKTEFAGIEVENRVIRRFLRTLAAIVILFVLGLTGHSRATTGDWNFTADDGVVIGLSLGLLLTIEGVRAFVTRKLS
ncbi:MAG: hypothetical protein AB3N16_07990 [Flavobacteriaceae bacterium]